MSTQSLNANETRDLLIKVCDAIIAAEPELSQADRDLGDGDHGLGMARGMTAAKSELEGTDFEKPGVALKTMGSAMMSSMGGASGAIFGTLFRAGGKACGDSTELGATELAATLAAAVAGIQKRGGANPGDKTMLDALIPASEKATSLADGSLGDCLAATAEAAEAGREASRDMIATMGRAKTLGEKSLGLPDAGACSVAIILRTMADGV